MYNDNLNKVILFGTKTPKAIILKMVFKSKYTYFYQWLFRYDKICDQDFAWTEVSKMSNVILFTDIQIFQNILLIYVAN